MKYFFYKFLFWILIICADVKAITVNNVEVLGNSRISNSTIFDIINYDKNKTYSEKDLNLFQKRLFETNFFSDVIIKLESNILIISVVENPLIQFFLIQGETNEERENLIYDSLLIGQNKIFSQTSLNQDIETIKNIYKNEGYFNSNVIPLVSKLPNGNLNIVLKIEKGKTQKIRRVFFIGDKYYKNSTLKDVISSVEHGWWKFFSSASTLNLSRIELDKKYLKDFYLNDGFYDIQILSSDVNLLDSGSVSLTYSINSGEKYNFSKYKLVDDDKVLNNENINNINNIIKDEIIGSYSLKKINNVKKKINKYLNLKKIEFVNFNISQSKLDKNKIFLEFLFNKTDRIFVNKINVKGNSITEEKVIRRELIFAEGDVFSKNNLDNSVDNLLSTGIFKTIKPNLKNSQNETIDIEFEVEEQPTGAISAGVGVGNSGSAVTTGISEKNLFGKGIEISSDVSLGTESIKGRVATTIPDFKNTDNDFIFNLYTISSDYENVGYESSVIGNSIATRYNIAEDIKLKPGFGIEFDSIDTNPSASQLYQSREGDYLTFQTFYNLALDKRDRKFQTTDGYTFSFGQTLAVPGSDIPYIDNKISASYYYLLNENYTLSVKSGLQSINAFNNKDVKLSDRKYLSNNKLRGFENFGIGPKDGKDHVGGNYSAYASIASTVPNLLPEKWNADSIVFIDMGNVWGVDYDETLDSNKIRSSIGIGLDWISPLGPLSFVFAQALSSADGDLEESFSFQIGSSF